MSIYEIPLPHDVLVAATIDCLNRFAPGYIEYSIDENPGLYIFHLSQEQLGKLCDLTIRKTGFKICEIFFGLPNFITQNEAKEFLRKTKGIVFEQLKTNWKEASKTLKSAEQVLYLKKKRFLAVLCG